MEGYGFVMVKMICVCECCDEVLIELEATKIAVGNCLTPFEGGDIIKYTSLCDDCREYMYGAPITSSLGTGYRLH